MSRNSKGLLYLYEAENCQNTGEHTRKSYYWHPGKFMQNAQSPNNMHKPSEQRIARRTIVFSSDQDSDIGIVLKKSSRTSPQKCRCLCLLSVTGVTSSFESEPDVSGAHIVLSQNRSMSSSLPLKQLWFHFWSVTSYRSSLNIKAMLINAACASATPMRVLWGVSYYYYYY